MKNATATALLAQMNAGAVSSEEIVRACLDRAGRLSRLNVFVHLDAERNPRPGPGDRQAAEGRTSRSGRWRACRWRSRT